MNDKEDDQDVEYLLEMCELEGVSAATVSDGHILVFKRRKLQELLDKNDGDIVTIFVKRRDATKSN